MLGEAVLGTGQVRNKKIIKIKTSNEKQKMKNFIIAV